MNFMIVLNKKRRLNMRSMKCCLSVLGVVTVFGGLAGCANYEVNSKRGNIPGYYIRTEMQAADRAVESARSAGKDKTCPAEFKAAEDAKNKAYDTFRACHTEEGVAQAKDATAKANALCPPQVVAPKPVPAPTAKLTTSPASIKKGEAAKLNWNSQNASDCAIAPAIGAVKPNGSMSVSPADSTTYKLACKGGGGSVESSAAVNVIQPPKDSDKDGVIDDRDKCPNTPAGTKVDAVGCPIVECKSAKVDINFATNKAEILPNHAAELEIVFAKLNKFPKATVVIEGHTDNVGAAAYNQKLSERRANAVKNYFIEKHGVAASRLKAAGYGESKPVASNDNADGRSKNRRVESVFTCP
jgi:OOP family OmpA-OmpF porin